MTMRSRRVYETDGLVVKLSYYGAGLAMPAHSHDFHQVSFLLGGGLSERHGGAAREMHQQGIGVGLGQPWRRVWGPVTDWATGDRPAGAGAASVVGAAS